MKLVFSLFFLLLSSNSFASNFGDLPSVLPIFWLGVIVSFLIAFFKAKEKKEEIQDQSFRGGVFCVYLFGGLGISFVLLIILFSATF